MRRESSFEIESFFEERAESRWLGEISITSNMQMTPPLGQKVVALGVRIYILKFNSLLKVDAE